MADTVHNVNLTETVSVEIRIALHHRIEECKRNAIQKPYLAEYWNGQVTRASEAYEEIWRQTM